MSQRGWNLPARPMSIRTVLLPLTFLSLLTPYACAQLEPDSAQVDLYFPQLADGGGADQQWQTSFVFVNPSATSTAAVALSIFGNDGKPLSLDLGSGLASDVEFLIPPQGSRVLRSKMASSQVVTGWAFAAASIPVQATVLFTSFAHGASQFQVSAAATLPTMRYWSAANSSLGIALANVYDNIPVTVQVAAIDANGHSAGTTQVTLAPMTHNSFVLSQLLPSLPSAFSGSVTISSRVLNQDFVAWTLNSDSGALSSLPSGKARWPISHVDRIWQIYSKLLDAAGQLSDVLGTNLAATPPDLEIASDPVINAFASRSGPNGTVQINLATSELISDSESELAFVVGHELGHILQFRTGLLVFNSNAEFDADEYGMLLSLAAGYDPYAAAGALAKISMASGEAGLVSQVFDNFSGDLHGSFDNRIAAIFDTISTLCQLPEVGGFCGEYKLAVHPHFPGSAPLVKPRSRGRLGLERLIRPSGLAEQTAIHP